MPYDNFPKDIPTDKIDACVHDVMGQGHPKPAAIAICYDSMVKGKELLQAIKEYAQKETGPAGDYLIVEDPEMPSTFHLRVKVDGKPDHTLMGAAWAALMNPNGYRGNVYEGPGKQEAIAKLRRLYEAEGMPVPSEKESLFIVGDAELSDAELQAIEQLYRDIGAGRVTLESLSEPDAATAKANVPVRGGSSGGSPGGNPSGSNQGGSQGDYSSKQERCFLHMKKLGGDDAVSRRICRSMFGARENKEARHYRKRGKAITDAPNLRADDRQSCYNCKYFESLPSEAISTGMGEVSSFPRGICTKYEFETGAEWVCDSWAALPSPTTKAATFAVYKQADGKYRWLAVTSSSFQDRDNEIVSQKALEADAERMNASGDYGVLDWWHTPIVLGTCDFSAMHGRLSVESGTFRDAYIAEKMMTGGYEMSRAFYHPITEPDPQGVYHNIKTFSRAVIPQGKGIASNRLTTFTVVKEEKEMLADKIKELVARFGGDKQAEERVGALLAEAEQKEQAAVAAGIAAKEQKPEAAPEAKPAPAEEKETSISKQPGMFVADMTPEEFDAHIANAVKPLIEQLNAIKEANAVAVKESSANVLAAALVEIKKLQDAQAATAQQVKELNGLTPRGYRATQDPATTTTKDTKPAADEKKPYFEQFVNGFVLGQPQPPMP